MVFLLHDKNKNLEVSQADSSICKPMLDFSFVLQKPHDEACLISSLSLFFYKPIVHARIIVCVCFPKDLKTGD